MGARRATRGYAAGQRGRNRIEEASGWIKGSAGLRQAKHRRREPARWQFDRGITACNLIRLKAANLQAA